MYAGQFQDQKKEEALEALLPHIRWSYVKAELLVKKTHSLGLFVSCAILTEYIFFLGSTRGGRQIRSHPHIS